MEKTETSDVVGWDGQRTELKGISKWVFEISAVFFVSFYLYSAGFGSAAEQYHLGLYILFTYALIGYSHKFYKGSPTARPSGLDMILVVISICAIGIG